MGYFFAGVLLLYCISGIAVNHSHDWNPSYVIDRRDVCLDLPRRADEITAERVLACLERIGESGNYRSFDFPSPTKIKVYLKDGDIVARLADGQGRQESIRRRPCLHEANLLHLNPKKWWLVFSDLFAGALIVITLTGLVVLKGRNGLSGRGKWLVGAGLAAPLAALFLM